MINRTKIFLKAQLKKLSSTQRCKSAHIINSSHPESPDWKDDIEFFIDKLSKGKVSDYLELEGWLCSEAHSFNLTVEVNNCVIATFQPDHVRHDVCSAYPAMDKERNTGFKLQVPITAEQFAWRGTSEVKLFYISSTGKQLLARSAIFHADSYPQTQPDASKIFYFTVASSNISLGGFGDFKEKLAPFAVGHCQLGFMAPVLYMRSTLGAEHDWAFDPSFDETRTQANGKLVLADSLQSILNYSINHQLPCVIGLNGGIWGDAAGSCPEWDLTDHLEQDKNNCQWNQRDEVMPDDYLKHLTGAESAPELSRSLTLNHYNNTVRAYKKRNLQQAGKLIAEFARENPDLYLGTNLDPDCYQNPFFEGKQWYDFNPSSLQQFRDWLSASGAYANELKNTIKHVPYSLDSLNAYLGTEFSCWDAVEPPRDKICKLWSTEDKFLQLWEEFRRHLVQRHYSDLASWLSSAGVNSEVIYSSQGFTAPQFGFEPFALTLSSPVKNYDSGGMSLEGSKPEQGHVGAILYGESARNNIRTENRLPFFENVRRLDPDWAVVEFNPADLRDDAQALPDYGFAWECLREMFNHGARFVNLMAWNGSSGNDHGQPHFNAHMALRDTPLEQAVIDFMLIHSDVPRGSVCYSFGSNKFASTDNWTSTDAKLVATLTGLNIQVASGKSFTLRGPQINLYRAKKRLRIELLGVADNTLVLKAAADNQDILLKEIEAKQSADVCIYEYEILTEIHHTAQEFIFEFVFLESIGNDTLLNKLVFFEN